MRCRSQNTFGSIVWSELIADQLYNKKFFQFVQDHLQEDPALLLLKHLPSEDFDLKEAARQITARKKARVKIPSWASHPEVLFPASLSMEQSSSELTARYKASRVAGQKMIDLTGGLGVDTFYMGQNFDRVIYVDQQETLVHLARHNFNLLNVSAVDFQFIHADSISFIQTSDEIYDWLYVDPARRGSDNTKLYLLSDCDPDLVVNWPLLKKKSKNILVKTSPMLDVKAALKQLPDVREVVVLAVKNEVREVLLWLSQWEPKQEEVRITAINLNKNEQDEFQFTYKQEETAEVTYSFPQTYLIEPNAAILKAGAFKIFAVANGLSKLHKNSHLYTTNLPPKGIQGRIFKIIEEVKLDKKVLKGIFPSGKVNVMVRNHPQKAAELKKKFKIKDGGDDFLLATMTLDNKARAYWCRKLKDSPLISE